MARKTIINRVSSPQLLSQVNPDNMQLLEDFISYLRSTQRSASTIEVYKNDIEISWIWCLQNNHNKFFVQWTKRDVMAYQHFMITVNKNSPARVRRIKAVLSSLSNFIESVLDDEYPKFRNIINKIQSPVYQPVREKTVLTEEQIDYLLGSLVSAGKFDQACMLALGACSGRRKAELILFKVDYFDEKNLLYGSLYRTPEKIKTKGRGNGKYIHCYTLASKFKPYFDLWMKDREQKGIQSEWLFPHKLNPQEHITVATLNSLATSFTKKLGVDFYWHSLRHYMTTMLAKSGIPDSVIAQIINWESVDMVSIYNDTSVDENLGKYFCADGIKKNVGKSLSDL